MNYNTKCNNNCCPPPSCQPCAPSISIGTVTTGAPGTPASVTNTGSCGNTVLNFVIPQGEAGPQGPAGPSGNASSCNCRCKEQMRNIIQQIIALYPNNELFITLDSGDAVIGRPGTLTLGPNGHTGVFEVTTTQNLSQYLPICNIDTIRVNSATYNNAIVYLPEPVPAPTDCCADCEAAIQSLLPAGTNTSIITNTQTASTGTVVRNEYGMIVLANETNNNISFISTCNMDLFTIST